VVNLALVLGIIAIFALPVALGWGTAGQPQGSAYGGTDNSATELVDRTDPGYRPWVAPVFSPSSAEVESGLFAVQAALGGGLLGFVLGRLTERRRT
jgi:cobalt/nickel transport protein